MDFVAACPPGVKMWFFVAAPLSVLVFDIFRRTDDIVENFNGRPCYIIRHSVYSIKCARTGDG
jgi:hypothetical protein